MQENQPKPGFSIYKFLEFMAESLKFFDFIVFRYILLKLSIPYIVKDLRSFYLYNLHNKFNFLNILKMKNYKYFILNSSSNPNHKLTIKQVAINTILIASNLILIGCIFSIPIATYYNSDKLDSSIYVKVVAALNQINILLTKT